MVIKSSNDSLHSSYSTKRKIIFACLIATLFLMVPISLPAMDFEQAVQVHLKNAGQIKSMIAKGTMEIQIINSATNKPINSTSANVSIYMKYPNSFKLVTGVGGNSTTIVQLGSLIHQKLPGSNTVITQPANQTSDLFSKYLGLGIDVDSLKNTFSSQKTTSEMGTTLTSFYFDIKNNTKVEPGQPILTQSVLAFDSDSLLRRLTLYSQSEVYSSIEYTYQKINGINVASRITTTVFSGSAKIISTISYSAVSINTAMSDKEFELK